MWPAMRQHINLLVSGINENLDGVSAELRESDGYEFFEVSGTVDGVPSVHKLLVSSCGPSPDEIRQWLGEVITELRRN